jgi:hypothetical protein
MAFENVGDQDIALNLGIMLVNGRAQLPFQVHLQLTDGDGSTRELHFMDRKHGGVAGRMDDYVVPLRVGSIHILKLSLDDFWCPSSKEFQIKLGRGKYQIAAQFEGGGAVSGMLDMAGVKFMPFWKGKLQSNVLAFQQ